MKTLRRVVTAAILCGAAPGGAAWLAPSVDDRAEIAALGAPCWYVRDGATKRLRARGAGALRVLVWAKRSRDAEVRERARVLLEAMGWGPAPAGRP